MQQAVLSMAELKGKVKNMVKHFCHSAVAAEKLNSILKQLRPNREVLKLKNDVVTQWN